MNGHWAFPLYGIGPDRYVLGGSFACNGPTAPTNANARGRTGMSYTVAYTATGLYTVTMPLELKLPEQPYAIIATPQWDAIANWFDVAVLGEATLHSTNRQFQIQAHRSGTANEPAANAGARVNFLLLASNNTGR